MAFPGEIGWIGKPCPDHPQVKLQAKIMSSAAGYYVGTQCDECRKVDPSPNSRESAYYESREAVLAALDDGTIKWRDTLYRPERIEVFGR